MNKKLIGFVLAIFAALGAVNAQGQQSLSGNYRFDQLTISEVTQLQGSIFIVSLNPYLVVSDSGRLSNYGSITVNGPDWFAGIANYGLITNSGSIVANGYPYGSFKNVGTFYNLNNSDLGTGVLFNDGSLVNQGNISTGELHDQGTITNIGSIYLGWGDSDISGSLVNQGSVISNNTISKLTIESSGTLTNTGNFITTGRTLINNGQLINSGNLSNTYSNFYGTTINKTGGLIRTNFALFDGNLTNEFGGTLNIGAPTFSSKTVLINSGIMTVDYLLDSNQGALIHNLSTGVINIFDVMPFANNYSDTLINDGVINSYGRLKLGNSIQGNGVINNYDELLLGVDNSTTSNSIYESLTSTLSFSVDSTGLHGTFTANHVNLDGTLELDLTNYTPALGETLRLILAHDFTGAFTNYRVLGKPQFTLTTNVVSLTNGSYAFDVNIVPLPASVWMLLSGLGGLGLMSRKHKEAKQ